MGVHTRHTSSGGCQVCQLYHLSSIPTSEEKNPPPGGKEEEKGNFIKEKKTCSKSLLNFFCTSRFPCTELRAPRMLKRRLPYVWSQLVHQILFLVVSPLLSSLLKGDCREMPRTLYKQEKDDRSRRRHVELLKSYKFVSLYNSPV
jgi:hypothetical protein